MKSDRTLCPCGCKRLVSVRLGRGYRPAENKYEDVGPEKAATMAVEAAFNKHKKSLARELKTLASQRVEQTVTV